MNTLQEKLSSVQSTWLITGVAGFIGSHLLEALLNFNQKVIGLDNFATGFKSNIDEVLSKMSPAQCTNFLFYEGDICSATDCRRAVSGVDYILHHAALGSITRSVNTPDATNEVNVNGFLNMLIAAKNARVKRFIYASSSSVYGNSTTLPREELSVGEPLSPYAASKRANELYAKAFAVCYEMQIVGLRYFNVFGPRQNFRSSYSAVIPLWITSLLEGDDIFINGDGLTSRDFCYVANIVQANILAAITDNMDSLNKVFNIAVGNKTNLNELFKMICTHLNIFKTPIYRDFRKGDVGHSYANIDSARNYLNYNPSYNLNQGLALSMQWFVDQVGNKSTEESSIRSSHFV